MVEEVKYKAEILGIILRTSFVEDGISFFTPNYFSQQLGYMKRKKDYVIEPHVHNPIKRKVIWTQEVLFIKSGKVRVDFYNSEKDYLESRILNTGDVILLATGGHGFLMLEESEIIEVKQGPYSNDKDKTRFKPVVENKIICK